MIPAAAYLVPAIATGIAGSTAYLTLARPSVPPSVDEAIDKARDLNYTWDGHSPEVRKENARIIVREFLAAGYPLSLAVAALTNARMESNFSHTIRSSYTNSDGTPEDSVGLFQLNIRGGGAGMTLAERQNPVLNTRRIIEETRKAWRATSGYDSSRKQTYTVESLEAAVARGATPAELAGLFGFHVERPKRRYDAIAERAAKTRELFPAIADVRTLDGGGVAGWRYAVILAVAGSAGVGAYYGWRRWAKRRRR